MRQIDLVYRAYLAGSRCTSGVAARTGLDVATVSAVTSQLVRLKKLRKLGPGWRKSPDRRGGGPLLYEPKTRSAKMRPIAAVSRDYFDAALSHEEVARRYGMTVPALVDFMRQAGLSEENEELIWRHHSQRMIGKLRKLISNRGVSA